MKNHKSRYILITVLFIGLISAVAFVAAPGRVSADVSKEGADDTVDTNAGSDEDAKSSDVKAGAVIAGIPEEELGETVETGEGGETVETVDSDEYIYCVASVSKVYATAAIMRLVDEGKVDLDSPVTEYIPEFKMQDDRYKDITVRMLADHTSGIMGTSQVGNFLYEDANTFHHDNLLDTLSRQRLKADPGEYAAYCNDGFDLMELIVERVTGMSYTDYVVENIAAKTGGKRTGSYISFKDNKDLAPAYSSDNLLYDNESCMCVGAGGIYSTASDVAAFGASFFTENDSLFSKEAKDEMAVRWNRDRDEYKDESGLGWDYVSMARYEDAGVRVLGKGGDIILDHAFLMSAPDEEISIAVLSNGGSSTYNGLMAEAIMDAVLNERGIIPEDTEREYKAAGDIPSEYDEYAGIYATQNALEGGAALCRVSFPGHKYMHVENISPINTDSADYILTSDGEFASLAYEVEDTGIETERDPGADKDAGPDTDADTDTDVDMDKDIYADMRISANPSVLRFIKDKDGAVYITNEMKQTSPGLGGVDRKKYIGEKISENPVSGEALSSFKEVDGKDWLLCNDIPSSANYSMNGIVRTYICREVPGYVFLVAGQGTRLLKIEDKDQARAFQTIPSSSNRDLIDISLEAGEKGPELITSSGLKYILKDPVPEFAGDPGEIDFAHGNAAWFKIDERIANTTLAFDKPVSSEIYVFNKYGDVVYTTHVKDASGDIPMPRGGLIVFLK